MSVTYRNNNTGDVVTYDQPNLRLDVLDNWERIDETDGAQEAAPEAAGGPEAGGDAAPQGDNGDASSGAPGGAQGDDTTTGDGDAEPQGAVFDPSAHNVDEVNDYLDDADAAEKARVLAVEVAGKNRATIVTGRHAA